MTTVGFIGLGIMGRPMAVNLVKAGFDVVGHNRSRAAVDELVRQGGRAAASTAEAAAGADVVITMLPDSPDVEEVVLHDDGVLANARPGLLFIDMSTVRPSTERAIAEAAARRKMRALDAPVSGGEPGAIDGSLSIMVGGEPAVFEEARPLFEAMGRTVTHVGPSGAGQSVKAANQLLVGGIVELVGEAIVLLEASGVDLEAAVRALGGGMAGSRILDAKAPNMLSGDFKPGFRVDLHHKDLGIVLDAGRAAGVSLPVTGVVAQLMSAALAQGLGSLDHSAIYKVVEGLSVKRG